jgi:hypothetical protein
MASGKVPKLVIKRHYTSSRKLKLPEEVIAEEQVDLLSGRHARVSRRTVAIRQAKTSLRAHFHLIAIGVCATIAMYGIVATLAASGGTPDDDAAPAAEESGATAQNVNKVMWIPDKDNPNIVKRIEIDDVEGTKTQLYRVEKKDDVTIYIPIPMTPPKPKPKKSTYEEDKQKSEWLDDIPY